jgi:hypothetical protein
MTAGLRCRSSAARLLRLWVRIPPRAWMFVGCECCVLSGRGLCDELITRPEESYRLWHVVVCDQEPSKTRRLKTATGLWKIQTQWVVTPGKQTGNVTVEIYLQCKFNIYLLSPKTKLRRINSRTEEYFAFGTLLLFKKLSNLLQCWD